MKRHFELDLDFQRRRSNFAVFTELIRDPDAAATLLKPPRPALLAALRQPDSASGLARRLGMPRQRVNHHLHELELTEQLQRLVRKYHAETSRTPYRFVLGAYPVSPRPSSGRTPQRRRSLWT